MSKEYLKAFLKDFSEAESCDTDNNPTCEIVGNFNNKLDKMDLRFNKNKKEVFKQLDSITKQDCPVCDATIGVFDQLTDKWKRNKLFNI